MRNHKINDILRRISKKDLGDYNSTKIKSNNYVKAIKVVGILLIINFPLAIYTMGPGKLNLPFSPFISLIVLMLTFFFLLVLIGFSKNKNAKQFSEMVIPMVIKRMNQTWKHVSSKHISEKRYVRSRLYKNKHERVRGNNFIEGVHKNISFTASYLNSSYTVSNGDETTTKYIFRGLFFCIENDFFFTSRTFITSVQKSDYKNTTIEKFFTSKKTVKKLPSIHTNYMIFSEDEPFTNSFINAPLLRKLEEIRLENHCEIRVSIIGNTIYVALEDFRNKIVPQGEHRGISRDEIKTVTSYFQTIEKIVELFGNIKGIETNE